VQQPGDGRVVHIAISERGRRIHGEVSQRRRQIMLDIMAKFEEDERFVLADLFERFTQAVDVVAKAKIRRSHH
jgi:DNA-binding MarR family transcriptional regulator